jgi:hypothetical protein
MRLTRALLATHCGVMGFTTEGSMQIASKADVDNVRPKLTYLKMSSGSSPPYPFWVSFSADL